MNLDQALAVLVLHDEDEIGPGQVGVGQPPARRPGKPTGPDLDVGQPCEHLLGGGAPPSVAAAHEQDVKRLGPSRPRRCFEIASTSKQFTVAAVLLAASEGKLQLDDDVRVHVPALPKLGETPTTIRHLIHHTGGLRDYGLLLMLAGHRVEGVTSVEETIDMLARQRGRDFEPGTKMEYSNTGYFLLAQAEAG
jgi:CubicO group peptidase (beta-lactamase class C family)